MRVCGTPYAILPNVLKRERLALVRPDCSRGRVGDRAIAVGLAAVRVRLAGRLAAGRDVQVVGRRQRGVVDRAHVGDSHVEPVQLGHGRDLRLDLVAVKVCPPGLARAHAEQLAARAERADRGTHNTSAGRSSSCEMM